MRPLGCWARLGETKVGDDYPATVMGVINVSPESFYKGSVRRKEEEIVSAARSMVEKGAKIIDVGAVSTAPYLEITISEREEAERLSRAIKCVSVAVDGSISADTTRSLPAQVAIDAGAEIINDVSGLKGDPEMAGTIAKNDVSAILMAHEPQPTTGDPIGRIGKALNHSLQIARNAGISQEKLVVDPGIGFFRKEGRGFGFSPMAEMPWYVWDCTVIARLVELRVLQRPICVGISRKSFIGKLLNQERVEDRLWGSLSAVAITVFNGAHIIRTHDVEATFQTVRLAESIVKLGAGVQ